MSNQIVISSGAKVRNLDGVLTGTSGIVNSVPLGGANGVATLDSGGKVPVSQLPASVVTYLGTWNAATNTPTLANGTGDAGDMYLCNVAGTVNFGAGPITFAVGDWVLYGSGTWQKSNGQNGTVTSVALNAVGSSALSIAGSPITTSGTMSILFNGTNLQYVNGAGGLTTFPSLTGFVTLDTNQTISALKTFDTPVAFDNAINMKFDTSITAFGGYYSLYAIKGVGSGSSTLALYDGDTNKKIELSFNNSNNYTYIFPSASGTIALTSDIPSLSGYVPYTGATADLDLGAYELSSKYLNANGASGLGGVLNIKQDATYLTKGNGYSSIASTSALFDFFGYTGVSTYKNFALRFDGLTDNTQRIYTLPNASGTLALTSDIPSLTGYVPYTGATANVNLGTYGLTAGVGAFSSSGGSGTFTIDHSSGSGVALTITKGGNGEGLIINKTSGSGNALSVTGTTNLTGALSGTSATFSGALTASNTTLTASANNYPSGALRLNSFTGGTSIYLTASGGLFALSNGGGADHLLIASTGAATFSSSVTAGGNIESNGSYFSVGNGYFGKASAIFTGGSANDAGFMVSGSNNLIFGNALTERMRITSGGNVGIGTSTFPSFNSQFLVVKGNSTNTNSSIQAISNDGLSSVMMYAGSGSSDNPSIIFQNSLRFGTSNDNGLTGYTERMRITSGGEVLVGSTSSAWSSANRNCLEIGGSGFTNALLGLKMGSVTGGYLFHSGTDMYLNQDQTNRLYVIANSGGVYLTSGATSWTANSDERLKDINGNIENAVDKLKTLRAVNFSWKKDENKKEVLGLIAQEVEKVFPQVIDKGELPNSPSNPNDDKTEYLGVRYQELVPVLVKAIQELSQEVNELKAKING